jgi:hypothetical protein
LVATTKRRPNNIYILDMKKREKTEGYLFPLKSGGEAIPFSIDVKGGEKLVS